MKTRPCSISYLVIMIPNSAHYEIITLKITLKFFVTLKRHGNHTEKYLLKGITVIIQDNHTEIFSFVVQGH